MYTCAGAVAWVLSTRGAEEAPSVGSFLLGVAFELTCRL